MKKKLPLIIGIVAIVIALIVAVVVLVISKNGKETAKEINLEEVSNKITENSAFKEMATEEISKEILESYFQVDLANVENVVGKVPLMNVHASLYVIVQAKDGKADAVKEDLNKFLTGYEEQWSRYLPEQYEYVQRRKFDTIGNYVYLIISEDSGKLENIVKE